MIGVVDWIREQIPEDLIGIPLVGIWFDLLINSLDIVAQLAAIIIGSVELWLPILSNLSRLSDVFGWIPDGSMQTAIFVGITILTASYLVRLLGRVRRRL
jgi:hypothetical protein